MLSSGQRSGVVRLWNKGKTLAEIAAYAGVPEDVIKRYLSGRKGYPDKIISASITQYDASPSPHWRSRLGLGHDRASAPETEPEEEEEPEVNPRKTVSLAKMPWHI